jgi:hypothetical protein
MMMMMMVMMMMMMMIYASEHCLFREKHEEPWRDDFRRCDHAWAIHYLDLSWCFTDGRISLRLFSFAQGEWYEQCSH